VLVENDKIVNNTKDICDSIYTLWVHDDQWPVRL
jgi:hypothetical protein